jgi:hypothetical protein
MARRTAATERFRVGKVTVYHHYGAWWLEYRRRAPAGDRTADGRAGVPSQAARGAAGTTRRRRPERTRTRPERPAPSGLGMTGKYTHTPPETLRGQVEGALRQWPASLALAGA